MGSNCGKYEEKLSAYLDGRLTPDEMAELAVHLQECPECSVLLEKMHRLDDLASEASLDFDDAEMDKLSDRIAAGIEMLDDIETEPIERKARIIPIWYRYVAVAASVAIIFFAGRMAFRENGMEPTRHRFIMPAPETSEPSMSDYDSNEAVESFQSPAEPAIEEQGAVSNQITVPQADRQEVIEMHPRQEKKASDQTDESRRKADAGEKQTPALGIPKPKTTETASGAVNLQDNLAEIQIENDKRIATQASGEDSPSEMAEVVMTDEYTKAVSASGKILGRITDHETGEPLAGATVKVEGTTYGAVSNGDGQFTISEIPPDTYDLVYSSTGYETEKVAGVPVTAEKEVHQETKLQSMALALDKSAVLKDDRKGKDVFAVSSPPQPPPSGQGKEPGYLTVDSLETLYARAISNGNLNLPSFAPEASSIRARTIVDKYIALIDSVEGASESRKDYHRLENMYMQARANYDLYQQTKEKKYLDRAREFKNALLEIINEKLDTDDKNAVLLDYKAEIERWRF